MIIKEYPNIITSYVCNIYRYLDQRSIIQIKVYYFKLIETNS